MRTFYVALVLFTTAVSAFVDTQVATDAFTRSNTYPDGHLVGNWTDVYHATAIFGNEAVGPSASNDGIARWTGAGTWTNDQYGIATLGGTIDTEGACVRLDSSGNGYCVIANGVGWKLVRSDAGTFTNLENNTGGSIFVTNDTAMVRAVGSTISAWRNGSQIGSNHTDSTYSGASSSAGVYMSAPGSRVTAWEGGTIGSSTPSPIPAIVNGPICPGCKNGTKF